MRNKPFTKTKNEQKSLLLTLDPSKIHIAEVMDTRSVTHNGAIKVWVLNSPYEKTETDKWITAYYISPFAGSTPDNKESNDFIHTKKSYGMWFTLPDVGTHVSLFFANGRNGTVDAYYFGCVPPFNLNHMIPGISQDLNSDSTEPRTEYNKATTNNDDTKAIYQPLSDGLKKQGLINDTLRGTGKSSARRESPSRVYGFLTPRGTQIVFDDGYNVNDINDDWDDNPNTTELNNPNKNPVNSNETRTNEMVRIRTRSGTQLLISEETGHIYAITKDGTAWLELHNDGYFDVYSLNDISLRSNKNINIRADNDINIEAGNDINIRTERGSMNEEIYMHKSLKVGQDYYVNIGNSYYVDVKVNYVNNITNDYEINVAETLKQKSNKLELETIGIASFNFGGDAYFNYGLDLYQAYLNGGIRPYYVRYTYTPLEPCVPNFYVPTENEIIPRCGSKDLEDFIATLIPPQQAIYPFNHQVYDKLDKKLISDIEWQDIYTKTNNKRLPQHEPWLEHIVNTKGYRNNVIMGDNTIDGQSLKIGSVTTKSTKPLTIVGKPRPNMPDGVYTGIGYNNDIPLYSYTPAPSGLLNPVNNYTTSKTGVDFIKEKEGFSNTVYLDVAGLATIGYGHLITKNERFTTITEEEATSILVVDLKHAESFVKKLVTVPLTQNQFDALVSFIFNLGGGAFTNSTMLKVLNLGQYELVPNELLRWKYANVNGVKKVVKGLEVRRIQEANMFSSYNENIVETL